MSPTPPAARGFTLIEVILATALFALLMSSYYVVFMRVVELEDYARSQRAFGAVGPAVLDLIEDDLQSLYTNPRVLDAFPLRGEDDSMSSQPADRINFVTNRASIHKEEFYSDNTWIQSPVNETGYRLASGNRGAGDVRTLYRREGYYVDGTPLQGGDYYEIYDRIIGLDIQYVGFPVEEEERTDQETLGDNSYQVFESWDSEERKFVPTAVIVTLTIEPPRLTIRPTERGSEEPEQRTFVRIIPLIQADDILPKKGAGQGQPPTGQPTGQPAAPAGSGR